MSNTNDLTAAKDLLPRIQATGEDLGYEVCRYCGKQLPRKRYTLFQKEQIIPVRCDCEKARKQELKELRERELELERESKARHWKEHVAMLYEKSGMGRRFMARTFESYLADDDEKRRAVETVKRYVGTFPDREKEGKGLYIYGGYGSGKTHLAASMTHALIQQGISVVCQTFGDMLLNVRDKMTRGVTEETAVQHYIKPRLLVIDDLGKEKCTEWSMSILYSIINRRYEDMAPVVITTNYDFPRLIKALTPTESVPLSAGWRNAPTNYTLIGTTCVHGGRHESDIGD